MHFCQPHKLESSINWFFTTLGPDPPAEFLQMQESTGTNLIKGFEA